MKNSLIHKNHIKVCMIVLIMWCVLWIFFLFREDKSGQYGLLVKFYKAAGYEKYQLIYGKDLYDFLLFCKKEIPEGSTYCLKNFDDFDVKKVRSQYLLWPLRATKVDPDFIILPGELIDIPENYEMCFQLDGKGYVLSRKVGT